MANGTVCKTVFCEFDSHRHLHIKKGSPHGGALFYLKMRLESNGLRVLPRGASFRMLLLGRLSTTASHSNSDVSHFLMRSRSHRHLHIRKPRRLGKGGFPRGVRTGLMGGEQEVLRSLSRISGRGPDFMRSGTQEMSPPSIVSFRPS